MVLDCLDESRTVPTDEFIGLLRGARAPAASEDIEGLSRAGGHSVGRVALGAASNIAGLGCVYAVATRGTLREARAAADALVELFMAHAGVTAAQNT